MLIGNSSKHFGVSSVAFKIYPKIGFDVYMTPYTQRINCFNFCEVFWLPMSVSLKVKQVRISYIKDCPVWSYFECQGVYFDGEQVLFESYLFKYALCHIRTIISSPAPKYHKMELQLASVRHSVRLWVRPHFQTWISLRPAGRLPSNFICSIIGMGEFDVFEIQPILTTDCAVSSHWVE